MKVTLLEQRERWVTACEPRVSKPAPKAGGRPVKASSTTRSLRAGPQLAPAPLSSSTVAESPLAAPRSAADSETVLRAAPRCTPSPPRSSGRSWSCFERWGDIDGGYRKLAHRDSYENLVWVSPSTPYRVLAAQGLVVPRSVGAHAGSGAAAAQS